MRFIYILILVLLTPVVIYSSNIKNDTGNMHDHTNTKEKNSHVNTPKASKTNKASTKSTTEIHDTASRFVAIKNVKRENVSAEKMVVYAYIAFFMLILGYIFFINRKISLVSKRLEKLEELNKE